MTMTLERDGVKVTVIAHFARAPDGMKRVDKIIATDIRPRERSGEGYRMIQEVTERYLGCTEGDWYEGVWHIDPVSHRVTPYATGGVIKGSVDGKPNLIELLSKGEYRVPAETFRHYKPDLLELLNKGQAKFEPLMPEPAIKPDVVVAATWTGIVFTMGMVAGALLVWSLS